jgi:hypothetical protein
MRALSFGLLMLLGSAGCKEDTKLKVTNIDPEKGDADGGAYVRIHGNRFLTDDNGNPAPANAKIYFGSRQGTIVRFASDDEIIAQAPGGKVGDTVDVLITFEGRGEIKIPKAFTFVEKKGGGPTVDDLKIKK